MDLLNAAFLVPLLKIVWVNLLLSGDNAVMIALAARRLPPGQQRWAILFGSAAAIVLRVLLTLCAVQLLQWPGLRLAGAVLLLWIGIRLLAENEADTVVRARSSLPGAVRTILVADLVMSLDNVLAVAAAADTAPPPLRVLLLVAGLGLSIPLIVLGSTLLLRLMARLPVLVTLGAALLGYVAGEMALADPALPGGLAEALQGLGDAVSLGGAVLVVLSGQALARRRRAGPSL